MIKTQTQIMRDHKALIQQLYTDAVPVAEIARKIDVSPASLSTFINRNKLGDIDSGGALSYAQTVQRSLENLAKQLYQDFTFDCYRYVTKGRVENPEFAGLIITYDEAIQSGFVLREAINELGMNRSSFIYLLNKDYLSALPEEVIENKIKLGEY